MKKFTLSLLVMLLGIAMNTRADVEWSIFSGSMAAGDWAKSLDADATWCKALEAGDQLVGTATIDTGKESDYSIQLYYGDTFISDFTYSEGTISYTLTAGDITNLQTADKGMKLKGKNFTLTSLKVKKAKSAIKTTISATGSTGYWDTSVDFPSNSLANAVENDYVLVNLSSSASGSQGKVGMSSNGTDTYGFNEYVQAFAGIVTSDMAGEGTKNGYVQGKNITVSSAALYHPLSSFSIGSIGYATFSASQQVTAPEGVTAYKATVNGSSVELTQFTDNVIPANTGAIIAGDEGAVLEFTASSAETSETSGLIACTTATDVTTLPSGFDYYVLYPGTGERADELALSSLLSHFGGWNADITWDSGTYTLTYTKATGNGEGGWVGADWSAYDKLKLTFSANTLDQEATFYVAYSGHDDATTEGELAQGAKTVTINLNSDYKNSIGNFSIYSSATTGSLTFESAALIDNDGATVAEFRKTTSGTLAANKAYLKIANGSGSARALKIVFGGDEVTGITTATEKKPTVDDERIYNLSGQVVTNPSHGIYIKNGKKFIVE